MNEHCPVCNSPIGADDAACPSCGFKLLGSTQSFQPVQFSSDEVIAAPKKSQDPATLRVIRGPQIEMVFHLGSEPMHVGRNPQCEIFLNDMTVSREHALVEHEDEGYRITDSNSFNGLWINNSSIESAVLQKGDIVQIGAFCLIYEENSEV